MRHLLESERPDRFVKTVHLLTKFKSYQWILKHTEIEWLLPLCSTAAVAAAQGEAPAAETPLAAAHAVWKILVEQGSWVERHALVDYHRAVGLLEPENTQRRAGVAAVNKIVRNTFPNNNVRVRTQYTPMPIRRVRCECSAPWGGVSWWQPIGKAWPGPPWRAYSR